MFKQEIEYIDFNGQERKEDFYFHLSLPELTRIEAEAGMNLKDHLEELIVNQDMKKLLTFLEDVILTSYGIKASDGRSFQKSKEIRSEFENSPAYAEFFEKLLTEEGMAQEFGEKVADNGKARKNTVAPKVVPPQN